MPRHYDADAIPAVYNIDELPEATLREGVHQKVLRGFDTLLGFTTLEPGCDTAAHSHPWEQVAIILEGGCDFHVGGNVVEVGEGDVFVIPPGVEHYAEPTTEDCLNMDVWPLREDYLSRTDYQDEFLTYDSE